MDLAHILILAIEPGLGSWRLTAPSRSDERLKVIAKGCEKPPVAQIWTIRDLAAAPAKTGISKSTVSRILKDIELKPHKVGSWLNSKGPDFEPKAAEICGLCLAPPENA